MIDQPIVVKNYTPQGQQFRLRDDTTKMLGGAIFKNKHFLTEKQRIQQSIEQNSYFYDTEPSIKPPVIHEFRERNTSKEIQPKMKFTASTQIERIIEAINKNRNGNDGVSQNQIKKTLNHFNKVQNSLQNQALSPKAERQRAVFSSVGSKKQSSNRGGNDDDEDNKGKDPTEALFKGGLTKKGKLLTFYSTSSQNRLQVGVSQYMLQNIYVAKTLNRHKKKMHFKAAQSVNMQHPGVLQNQSSNNRFMSITTPKQSENPYSLRSTSRNFYPQLQETNQLNASKSAFFLPLKKDSHKSQSSLQLNDIRNIASATSLPQVNPLVISKEKQKQMMKYLDEKSMNPYEKKMRKKQVVTSQDRAKIDTLMSSSCLNSSYFPMFYKENDQKKLRFQINKLDLEDSAQKDENGGMIEIQEENPFNPFGVKMSYKDKEEKAKLKILGIIKQVQRSRDKVEDAAYEILTGCNAIVDKNISSHKFLRKGEGKTVGGSGLTNYMVYDNLVKTL